MAHWLSWMHSIACFVVSQTARWPASRAFSEYREIRISGYDFDMSDIQISEYEGIEYENVIYVCLTVLVYM